MTVRLMTVRTIPIDVGALTGSTIAKLNKQFTAAHKKSGAQGG
jgi:hypothetical protein